MEETLDDWMAAMSFETARDKMRGSGLTPLHFAVMTGRVDLVEALDVPLGRVRRLIDEHYLVGSRRTGVFAVPAAPPGAAAPSDAKNAVAYTATTCLDIISGRHRQKTNRPVGKRWQKENR